MKNLDLNNYGVQEMNAEEMRVTEGGYHLKTLVKFLEFLGVVEVAQAFLEGFTEGFNEGYKDQQKKK